MLTRAPIASLDDPQIAPYRTMRRQFDHFKEEIFVAEGEKVLERLLRSSISVISLLLPDEKFARFEAFAGKRSEAITAFTAPKSVLEQLTGFHLYHGVLALARVPAPCTLEAILESSVQPRLLIALDWLSNSENLGVVIRNAVAFVVDAILLSETCAPPYLRRSVRNSMGTVFKCRYLQTPNLPGTLAELRRGGVRIIAAHPRSDQSTLASINLKTNCCIVFGSEGHGISKPVLAACDEAAAIPMHSGTDSLNVASATAVFLFEAQRQRMN